jgi:hypothetical protein
MNDDLDEGNEPLWFRLGFVLTVVLISLILI